MISSSNSNNERDNRKELEPEQSSSLTNQAKRKSRLGLIISVSVMFLAGLILTIILAFLNLIKRMASGFAHVGSLLGQGGSRGNK